MNDLEKSKADKIAFIKEKLVFDKTKFEITAVPSHISNTLILVVKNIEKSEQYTVLLSDTYEILTTNKVRNQIISDFNVIGHIEKDLNIIKNRFLFLTAFLIKKTTALSFNGSQKFWEDDQLIVQTKFKLSVDKKTGQLKESTLVIAKFNNKKYEGKDLKVIKSIINDEIAIKLDKSVSEVTFKDSILLDIINYA